MKKDKNLNQIGDLIRFYARSTGQEERYLEAKIKNNWEKIVGQDLALETKLISLHNKILYLQLNSPVAKNHLLAIRDNLKVYLNKFLDYKIETITIF